MEDPHVPHLLERALSPPLTVLGEDHQLPPPRTSGHANKKRRKMDDRDNMSANPSDHLSSLLSPPMGSSSANGAASSASAAGANGGFGPGGEPRRLRRLHEACARCRRKKIKCDSMMPNCGACSTAGVECTQEDRHRQMLKPRAWQDQLEAQIDKCVALLATFISGFQLEHVDHYLKFYNVPHHPFPPPTGAAGGPPGTNSGPGAGNHGGNQHHEHPQAASGGHDYPASAYGPQHRGMPGHPGMGGADDSQHHPITFPNPTDPDYFPQASTSRSSFDHGTTPPRASPGSGSASGSAPAGPGAPAMAPSSSREKKSLKKEAVDPSMLTDDKGRDPHGNDMSAFSGLIRGFGVGKVYTKGVKPEPPVREDVIGGIGMSRPNAFSKPHNPAHWTSVALHRDSLTTSTDNYSFLLPRDRRLAQRVLDCYFDNLNPHRPVFMRKEFMSQVDALYDSLDQPGGSGDGEEAKRHHGTDMNMNVDGGISSGPTGTGVDSNGGIGGAGGLPGVGGPNKYKDLASDAGFLCSVYLVFALGTMAVRNRRAHGSDSGDGMEENWPSHEDFYDLALLLKPDLANSISTLQALILLHWYLYCERHGKALWRLVGNLVRLAIELGLHHDPSEQEGTFTFEERQLRSQLWYICLVHDRGTSIMFGRPLAVQIADYRTPFPTRLLPPSASQDLSLSLLGSAGASDESISFFSEDFELSKGLMDIQGEIVCLLLRPGKLTGEELILHAVEIEKQLEDWRQSMPPYYKRWFGASSLFRTQQAAAEEGSGDELLADVTVDGGLVMLKYAILRMFLLRTIFMNTLVKTSIRFNALRDAVITAHNVLAFHACLTQQPDVAFFVSPIPIQMTAMIILYARFSKVEALDPAIAKEDCALALKLVPELRWRWERQDNKGSHPLIARLAYKLLDGFDENPKAKPMLLDENYWVPNHILQSRTSPNIEELLLSPPSMDVPLPNAADDSGNAGGPRVITIPQAEHGRRPQQAYHTNLPTSSNIIGLSPTATLPSSSSASSSAGHPTASTDMNGMPQLVNFDHFNSGNMHYFPDPSAPSGPGRLMNEFPYQQAPTTYNLQQMARAGLVGGGMGGPNGAGGSHGGDLGVGGSDGGPGGMGPNGNVDDVLLEYQHQHLARAAAGHVPGGVDPEERYEIWQSRHTYDGHYRPHEY